jgi:hypothetical protein
MRSPMIGLTATPPGYEQKPHEAMYLNISLNNPRNATASVMPSRLARDSKRGRENDTN